MMNFLKGSRGEFEKVGESLSWEEKADTVKQHMMDVFGAKNLSFLMGSGCSSFLKDGDELGIPTMKFLAKEFQKRSDTSEQKKEIKHRLGIDLSSDGCVTDNLEETMAVLTNAHQLCERSEKPELNSCAAPVNEVIADIKKFILEKCTKGAFSKGDESVVALYKGFYQSLTTRSRGLAPPWVFTTNYDLFNEQAMDRSGIPYSNGFSGTIERKFNPATYRLALAEQLDISSRRRAAVDGFVYFCKLHGSVNWHWTEEKTTFFPIEESRRSIDPDKDKDQVMIYPSPSKQKAIFCSPYSDMFREFQRQIVQDQSVLVIMGFSFGDEHVNNIIFQGLTLPSFRLVIFMDPDTNDTTRKLRDIGDSRVWFIWGEEEEKKAHHFGNIVSDLLPKSADKKVEEAIENVLGKLPSSNRSGI